MNKYYTVFSIVKIAFFFWIYDFFVYLGDTWLAIMGGSWEEQPYLADSLACILMLPFYGLIFYFGYIRKSRQENVLDTTGKTYTVTTVMTLGMGGISYGWLTLVDVAFQNIPFIQESTERFQEFEDSMGNESYFWVFLSVVAIGPIVEELIFRGLIFNEAEKIRAGWFPVIMSAVLFGLFHMEFVQIIYTIIMGFIFGLVYQRTRSFVLVCYMHILNNLLVTPPGILDNDAYFNVLTVVQIIMILPAIYLVIRWIKVY
ncbi:MAG: CPBP family intramembrane metalloprotease [Clostridiales bacterium]|nr:CPBP family intramembrane metalloprotease [Clostridiales bacterium]